MSRNLYFEDELTREKFNGFMLKRLIQYAGAYKLTYIKVIFMLIGTSFLSLLPTAINAYIIENILPQNGVVPENILVKSVIMLSLWMTLSIGGVVSGYITAKISSKLGNAIVCNLREDLFQKLMELSFDYYDNRPTGKILVRITNYTDEIAGFFINDMTRIVENIFTMVIAIIAIIVIEPRMGLVTIIVSMPLGLLMWWVAKKLHERVRNDRNKSSNRTAFVAEAINGLEVIKAFNREELNDEIFIELSDKYHKAFMQSTRYREIFFPLSHGIIRIMCTVILYATALFIATNNIGAGITLGALVTITTYMQRFSSSVFTICQRLQSITNITANVERIFEVLDTPAKITDKVGAVDLADVKGAVDFRGVTFSYVDGVTVLENIDLSVEPGQMIALVGPTGAGKTTIVSLISRFYDIDQGQITIDGQDIRDVTLASLRDNVGVMMQDTFLFRGTIMDNIRFSRPDATDEECIEAAKKVCAHEFIMKKPEGYNTEISGNGSELSAGEKQLVSFARLILGDPKIIILDEATSNIDTETEKLVQEMFKTVLKGRTSFVIAHRLSTIRNADRILYIDKKSILEDGSHDELMAKEGYYYKLVKH
ncbi:MAG: ABC transporter ATP-binding protein [Lachnospiraceae bacterium]|nr:ABC transporter ATP-binding protein [Lachnospiraceae bacterium]